MFPSSLILLLSACAANAGSLVVKPEAAAKFRPAVANSAPLKPPVMTGLVSSPQAPSVVTPQQQQRVKISAANTRPAVAAPSASMPILTAPFANRTTSTTKKTMSQIPMDILRFMNLPFDSNYGEPGYRRARRVTRDNGYDDSFEYTGRTESLPKTEQVTEQAKEPAPAELTEIPRTEKPGAQNPSSANQASLPPPPANGASDLEPPVTPPGLAPTANTPAPPPITEQMIAEQEKKAANAKELRTESEKKMREEEQQQIARQTELGKEKAKKPEAPEKKDAEFAQCGKGQLERSPAVVSKMFIQILGLTNPTGGALRQVQASHGARPSLQLVQNGKVMDIEINHPMRKIRAKASFCQNEDGSLHVNMDISHDTLASMGAGTSLLTANLVRTGPNSYRSLSDEGKEHTYLVERGGGGRAAR